MSKYFMFFTLFCNFILRQYVLKGNQLQTILQAGERILECHRAENDVVIIGDGLGLAQAAMADIILQTLCVKYALYLHFH